MFVCDARKALIDVLEDQVDRWVAVASVVEYTHVHKNTSNNFAHVYFRSAAAAGEFFRLIKDQVFQSPWGVSRFLAARTTDKQPVVYPELLSVSGTVSIESFSRPPLKRQRPTENYDYSLDTFVIVLPTLFIADVADLEFDLSANRSVMTVSGDRTLPTIFGAAVKPLPSREFRCVVEIPSAVTSVGLEASLRNGILTARLGKISNKKLVLLSEFGSESGRSRGRGKGRGRRGRVVHTISDK